MKKRKFVLYSILGSFGLITMFSCNGIKSEKITLSGDDAIELGETAELNAEVLPKETSDKKINWSSSDSSVAFVDSDGKVTGIKPGKVTITATSNSNGRVKQSIEMNIGNYVSTHVSSVTLDPAKTTLEDGEYSIIQASVLPSNADNKKVTWKSSNPDLVSVNEYGVIKAEQEASNVKITATSVDGGIESKEVTINVTKSTKTKKLISFREPSCISNYKLKSNEAEDIIDATKINRDNSSEKINGNFYKNNEHKLDTYKVGNKNDFKIRCVASWGTGVWDDFTEVNPWQTVTVTKEDGSSATGCYEELDPNSKQNKIKFTDSAAGQTFKITILPNKSYYDYDTNDTSKFERSFVVEVVDGYNVYNFADLTTLDNWSLEQGQTILGPDHSIFKNNEFIDCWGKFKSENNIPTTSFNNVVLQSNVTIKNDYLPDYIKWTDHETDDYINGVKNPETKERFNKFVEIKSNIHQDDWKSLPIEARRAKCRYLLNGSQKDETAIFNRMSKDTNFALEGNYFTIDASDIKPVTMFEQTTLDAYQKNATNTACLIDFGGWGGSYQKYHICSKQEGIKEDVFDNFRPYTTGNGNCQILYQIKNVQIHGNSTRDVHHDEGMGGVNLVTTAAKSKFTNLLCHECANAFYGLGDKYVDENEKSLLDIERCKVFDMFASFVRTWHQREIQIKDSFFKDCSGFGFTIDEPVSETYHTSTKIDLVNTFMESFVSGDEVFNKNNLGHIIIKVLAAIGLGAFEQYKDLSVNKHSFIKIEDGIPKVNLLMFHNYSPFLQSVDPGLTSVTAKNTSSGETKDIIKLRDNTNMEIYNNMDLTARTILSMPFQSSEGGHARIPFWDIAEANDLELYDEHISEEVSSHQTYNLSYYKEHKAEIDASIPTYKENFEKLFSGDYLTTYFAALGNYMSAFVLGYK